MSANTAYDIRLGERLHDAYDAMGPDAATQERVFKALQAREQQNEPHLAAIKEVKPARRNPWLIVLPLAACLALAFVVSRVALPTKDASFQDGNASVAAEQAPSETVNEMKAEDEEAIEYDAIADEAVAASEPMSEPAFAEVYPLVTLSTGETLRVGEPYEGEVDETNAVAAIATDEDAGESVSCEVVQDADAFFVRYEGDITWYTAKKVD